MMIKPPLLSIIIATKNREKYCVEAIKSILSIPRDDLQLTIADNSSSVIVKEFVESISEPRISYSYDNSPLSSIDNFNRCMKLATGEYVCMIGDDDTVLPIIMKTVDWMKAQNIDSVCSKKNIDFVWPNQDIDIFKEGLLKIPAYTLKTETIDVEKGLTDLITNGIINYSKYNLPRVYHGIIKRNIFEAIYRRTGHYFGGLSPDIYSTIALCCYVKTHNIVDYPFSIAGACPSSTSISSLSSQHSGLLKDAPHFVNRKDEYNWEPLIPRFYSVETIWAETGLKTLKDLNRQDLVQKFSFYRFASYAIVANLKFFWRIPFKRLLFLLKLSITESYLIRKELKVYSVKHIICLSNSVIQVLFSIANTKKSQQGGVVITNAVSLQEAVSKTQQALENKA